MQAVIATTLFICLGRIDFGRRLVLCFYRAYQTRLDSLPLISYAAARKKRGALVMNYSEPV